MTMTPFVDAGYLVVCLILSVSVLLLARSAYREAKRRAAPEETGAAGSWALDVDRARSARAQRRQREAAESADADGWP